MLPSLTHRWLRPLLCRWPPPVVRSPAPTRLSSSTSSCTASPAHPVPPTSSLPPQPQPGTPPPTTPLVAAHDYVSQLATSGGPYYALVEIKGRPYHLTRGDLLTVPHLKHVSLGSQLMLDKVREIGSNLITLRGHPFVADHIAHVHATVVEHWMSEKRYTVKTKRRKGYKRTIGHRQLLTSLRITDIVVNPISHVSTSSPT